MAGSVIDALVVTLGLDSKGFATGIKGSTEQLAGFTRKLTGMFLAVRGLEDVVGYFKDLHAQLADIGFTARNLGVAGTEIKRLGEVSELFGGQMADAAQSVEGLQAAVFGLKYRGQMSDSLMMLQRFGVAYLTASGHMRNFRDIATDAAAAIDRQAKVAGLDQGERYQMALSFGFTGGIASAVAQGGKGLEKALSEAQQDQKTLTEKTIAGQVALSRDLTRNSERLQAVNSTLLASMVPIIQKAADELTKLVAEAIPHLTQALNSIEKFLKNPPAWLKTLEQDLKQLAGFLGPTGSLVAAIIALTAVMKVGGAAKGLGNKALPIAGTGIALGYYFDKLFPNNWLAQFGRWIGGKAFDFEHPFMPPQTGGATGTWATGMAGGVTGSWSVPTIATPGAARPASESSSAAPASPLALVGAGGTNVEIGSMTINTRATDAQGIAADMSGALRRKLLVSTADGGQG